jgi:ABC-type Zn2+ transport system substrate-binding protein/surface adhesin
LAGNYYFQTSLQGLNSRLGLKGVHIHDHIHDYKHEHEHEHKHKHDHDHEHEHEHDYEGYVEPKPIIFKVRLVL